MLSLKQITQLVSLSTLGPLILCWGLWSILLAVCVALHGFLVGPLLRSLFGGDPFQWPIWIRAYIEPIYSAQDLIHSLPWWIIGVSIGKALSFYGQKYTLFKITYQIGQSLRVRLTQISLTWSIDQQINQSQAQIHRRFTHDVEQVEKWIEEGIAPLIRDGLQILGLLTCALIVGGYVGLIVLLIYPFLFLPIVQIAKALKKASRLEISSAEHMGDWTLNHLHQLPLIQATGVQANCLSQLNTHHQNMFKTQAKRVHLQGIAPLFTELSTALCIAGSLWVLFSPNYRSEWQAESLLGLFICLLMMYQPLKAIQKAYQAWIFGSISFEKIYSSLNESSPLTSSLLSKTTESRNESLYLDHSPYLKQKEWTQQNVPSLIWTPQWCLKVKDWVISRENTPLSILAELNLPMGQWHCITGVNGSGKSSFFFQLLGLNPAYIDRISRTQSKPELQTRSDQGSIWIEEYDSSISKHPTYTLDESNLIMWRIRFAWAPQSLPPMTLSLQEWFTLCLESEKKRTDLNSFKSSSLYTWWLKFNLEDLIHRVGGWDQSFDFMSLSGGERQKLSLLKACFLPRPFILIDEPEAHLDEKSMHILLDLLNELCQNQRRGILVISHSPLIQNYAHHQYELIPYTSDEFKDIHEEI